MNNYSRFYGILALTFVMLFIDLYPEKLWAYDRNKTMTWFKNNKYELVVTELMPIMSDLKRDMLLILGESQSMLGNHIAAIKVYSVGIQKNPKDIEMKARIGFELMKQGKEKESIQQLKEVLDINTKFLPAYKTLIQIYEKKKNKYELRLLYQDMIEKFGEKNEYISKLCEISTLSGLYDLSVNYCKKGILLDPNFANNFVYLGLSYKDMGNFEEAEKVLKKSAETFSESEFNQITLALFYEEQKNYLLAYKYFTNVVKINPLSLQGLVGVGSCGVEIQKLDIALDSFKKACKLNKSTLPSFRRALKVLGQTKNKDYIQKFESEIENCQQI